MWPYTDAIAMKVQREWMPDNGTYSTSKSTPSRMDDTYEHVLEYKSY